MYILAQIWVTTLSIIQPRDRPEYTKLLLQTGWIFYDTQAWAALQISWLGFKIAKSHGDRKKIRRYSEGISKFQKELDLGVERFPNLGMVWNRNKQTSNK